MADKGKLKILIILMCVLLVGSLGLGGYFMASLAMQAPTAQKPLLENGSTIHVNQNGTFHIYLENFFESDFILHNFTFTDLETGVTKHSHQAQYFPPITYRINNLSVRMVATVNLDSGRYILEFEPLRSSG